MTDREFIFRLSAYDTAKLLPQTRKALKTHTEMLSRECCPRLWKATDALNAKFGGDEKKIKRSRITSVVYLALEPMDDNPDDAYVILKLVTDENGEEVLVTIDDDDEFDRIADMFEDEFMTVEYPADEE